MKSAENTLFMVGILINTVVYSVSGQWVQTNGPCGGRFETVTISDSLLYTNVLGKGVFRSTDDGKKWAGINNGLVGKDVISLASLGNELFAGTELNGIYIYAETDNRWTSYQPKSGHSFNRIFEMTGHEGELWAATDNGLMKLFKENGEWMDSLMRRAYWSQALAVTDSFLFISSENLLERSADRGGTWIACTAGLPPARISCLLMLDDRQGFIGTEEGPYATGDGGISWSSVNGGIATRGNFRIRGFTARNDTILYSSSDRIWISVDKGMTWADFNAARTFESPGRIGLMGTTVVLATSKGIFKSSFSDRIWTDISAGIVTGSVAAMLRTGTSIFAGGEGNGKLFRSDDNGLNWTVSDSGFDAMSTVYALTSFDSVLFVGCDYLGQMQSTDSGRSWTRCPFTNGRARAFAEINGTLLAGHYTAGILSLAGRDSVFQDANAGIGLEIPECGCSAPYPTPFSFAVQDSAIFVALENHGVFSTKTDPINWHSVNHGLLDTGVNAVFAHGGILLAGTQGMGIYRSTDMGASWNTSGSNLSGIPVSAFADHGTIIFAGTGKGVFYSFDSGVSWSNGETSFNDSIQSLLVDGDYLLAGTATRGVWRRRVAEFGTGAVAHPVKNEEKGTFVKMLKRGHVFSCRVNLTRTERVSLKLYDLQGKMLALLESSRAAPGEHLFQSDLRLLKSGCYIIRFESESACRSKAFIISGHP